MAKRKPQINFQVDEPMKLLYDEAKLAGHWVTRFCAAGLLMMVEDPAFRVRALSRLREWEAEYEDAGPDEIRDFVTGAEAALQQISPATRAGAKKKAKRSRY